VPFPNERFTHICSIICTIRSGLLETRAGGLIWCATAASLSSPNQQLKMSTLAQKNGMRSAYMEVGSGFMVGNFPIRVTCFLVLAACGALCQEPSGKVEFSSLPDAPSVQASAQAQTAVDEASPLISRAAAGDTGVMRGLELANGTHAPRLGVLAFSRKAEPPQRESNDFFAKHLYPSLLKRNFDYHPSASSSLLGRATYAATRVFVVRDESGKGRVNTSYFVGVLTSAVVHTAYRPYWRRSPSDPFSNFGSTIGNDAGMNVLHEFGPGLQQLMKNHAPKFVSRIEERIGR